MKSRYVSRMISTDDAGRFNPVLGEAHTNEICMHTEQNVGRIECLYHELSSSFVHVDVFHVKPNNRYPFHTLVTSGMSNRPMKVPEGLEEYQYAELCLLLPPDWPVETITSLHYNSKMWPMLWLMFLARFPHEFNTWFYRGHTIPNGQEAEPYDPTTHLCCMMLLPSLSLPEDFNQLHTKDGKIIHFYCLYPLYSEEYAFKLQYGTNAIIDRFEKYGITDIINTNRRNVCL